MLDKDGDILAQLSCPKWKGRGVEENCVSQTQLFRDGL